MAKTITSANGVTIRTLRSAPRGRRLQTGDTVGVFYVGSLPDGTLFDANIDFNGFQALRPPFVFTLGQNQVIRGWEEGLLNRQVGEVIELTIPSELGYGSSGQGSIPPNATLVFQVVLLGMIGAEQSSLPEDQRSPVFYDLRALGLTSRALGLSRKLLANAPSSAVTGRLLVGTDQPDTITGRSEGELLVGLRGNDRLTGRGGRDLQVGGKGADAFVIEALSDSGAGAENRDLISDFKGSKGDRIDLRGVDADANQEGVQAFRFIKAAAFSGQPGELRYSRGLLQGDVTGNRQADLEIELLGNPKLQASHLLL